MADIKYTYAITDFPNNKADVGKLYVTILEDSNFTHMIDSINVNVDDCDIWFREPITPAEWATLSGIVAAHDGEEYVEEKPAIDQSMYGKNAEGSWVPMRFNADGRLMVDVQTQAGPHGNESHTSEFVTVSGIDEFGFLTTVSGGAHDDLTHLDYASSGHTGFAPEVHTHTESDITDLDKYTQAEVDNLVDTTSGTLQTQIDAKPDTFLDLDDTPSAYIGSARRLVRVNSTADGLEFLSGDDEAEVDATYSGIIRHGYLRELDEDQHPALIPRDGSRGFTSTVSGIDPIESYHLTTKNYIDEAIANVSGTGDSLWTDAGAYIYRDGSVLIGDTTWSGTARLYIRGYTLLDETHWIRAEGIEAGQGINDGGLFVVKYREDEALVLLLGDHNNNPLIQLQQTGTGGTEDNPDHYIKFGMAENLSSDFYIGINGTERLRIETNGTLSVAGTTDYETLVTADDDIPNKKYVDDEIAAIPGGGVFGSEYNAETSESQSSTTSTSWQNKIDFDVDVPAGNYILHWYSEIRMNSTSYSVVARVEMDGHSEPPYIGYMEVEPQDTDNWYVFSGHKVLSLNGTHDIDLDYCRIGSGGTAYIRKGRFTLWRIS